MKLRQLHHEENSVSIECDFGSEFISITDLIYGLDQTAFTDVMYKHQIGVPTVIVMQVTFSNHNAFQDFQTHIMYHTLRSNT